VDTFQRQTQIERELTAFQTKQPDCDDAPPSVRVATEHIHAHLFDPGLTVKRLRDRLGLTDSMFSPRFRRYHGRTPGRYIRHLRVEAAKRLLRRFEDVRISEVAFHVGYEHYRTFARVFKRVVGQSPQAFREHVETST
jgi:AraC-like DNA-binding protein